MDYFFIRCFFSISKIPIIGTIATIRDGFEVYGKWSNTRYWIRLDLKLNILIIFIGVCIENSRRLCHISTAILYGHRYIPYSLSGKCIIIEIFSCFCKGFFRRTIIKTPEYFFYPKFTYFFYMSRKIIGMLCISLLRKTTIYCS